MSKGSHQFLDSPSTTSAITYKVQFNSAIGGFNALMQYDDSNGDGISEMTLMEIAPGLSTEDVQKATGCKYKLSPTLKEFQI